MSRVTAERLAFDALKQKLADQADLTRAIIEAENDRDRFAARIQELEAMIDNARNERGVTVADAPSYIYEAGAVSWVSGYEAGQNSVLRHFDAPAPRDRKPA